MLPRRVCSFFLFAALLVSAARAAESPVQASLVALETSIQPGKYFDVALRLQQAPGWHTYWINAGTGYPTSLDWKLPDGFKAGTIQWPVPHVLHDVHGTITGNGYEGEVFLPVAIKAPDTLKPGDTITLRAHAGWLMCQDVCMPGQADVELTLPVSRTEPEQTKWFHLVEEQPRPDLPEYCDITAVREGKTVRLRVKVEIGSTHLEDTQSAHFFSKDGFIQYDEPQTINSDKELILPISESADPATTRLVGVLTMANSRWALMINVPITAAGAAVESSTSQITSDKNSSGSELSTFNSQPSTPVPSGSLLGTLALAFIGGLILNLMPCVFPVLGIKILGFVNQAGHERGKVVAHGLVFTAGMLLSFWTLAGVLAVLRAGGDQLGWGFQLQSPAFVFGLTAVMLVFALNMSGVFEFGLAATGVGAGLQRKSGYAGSFFTGVLATVVATPCSAPFLAPALGAALALSTIQAFAVFTAIAIGLSTPYLLLSIFPGAVKVLPRPGAWMETFKQFMAFPLYATVGYLVWVLAGQVSESHLLTIIFALVLMAMGAWFYGRWNAPGASAGRARFGLIAGFALLGCGAWLGWPHPPAPTDITREPWSAGRVAQLRAENRIIDVDFTARWCATCQANKKFVFHDATVLKTFRDKKIATLRGDWTNADPLITAELAKYHRSAVPFNLVYLPGEPDPETLPELLTPGIVLQAVDKRN
ncbi:MAG TPA: protein-disulfide reductase DsbD domain-containing protein [Opitutaceae bacterium]|nr:protein-disulfide reductase DsbD domain-containing protein [Opitutaceae bacterium]